MSHGPLALPCFMLIFFQSASSYANCQSSQSDVVLWDKLPVFNFILNICSSSKQFREASNKPNHYNKMVINCGPNIQIMRERERERERLWVERWGKEIELKEVYGYGCVGKEIYCISLPTPPIPFISFGFFLSPLLSHLYITFTLFVNQQCYLFILLSNDFISESSLSFSFAVCLFILYHFNRKLNKKIIKIFNFFFLFLIFFLKYFINECLYLFVSKIP